MDERQWVGIDVCQKYLDIYVRPQGKLFQETNDEVGISKLVQTLKKIQPELIVIEATGTLAKTDAIDAKVLAHFADAIRPEVREMSDESSRQLEDLVQRRRQIGDMIAAEKNRRRGKTNSVQASIDEYIEWLEQQLKEIESQIKSAVARNQLKNSRGI